MFENKGNAPSHGMSVALVVQSPSSTREKCRCGVDVAVGEPTFRVVPLSPASELLFRDQVFCSTGCIRNFCLESLETLDALDTPDSVAVVRDVHELYRDVAETYAAMLSSTA